MAFLEVQGLHKSFGKSHVLKGIDFSLNAGEVLSIIGSSGNGKTTLLRCINFLERAEKGKIFFNGECIYDGETQSSLKESDIRKARLHFGLVFQNFNLFPQYTAFDNIRLPLTLMQKEKRKKGEGYLSTEKIDAEIYNLLDKIGLKDKAKNYPCELSGGQQQRVAIARAMALKPDILCFDEPTSALDPEFTVEVLKVIKELKRIYNITMIIVTHEMQFARGVSDKVMFLSKGVVEEIGTPEQIFEKSANPVINAFLKNYSTEN